MYHPMVITFNGEIIFLELSDDLLIVRREILQDLGLEIIIPIVLYIILRQVIGLVIKMIIYGEEQLIQTKLDNELVQVDTIFQVLTIGILFFQLDDGQAQMNLEIV